MEIKEIREIVIECKNSGSEDMQKKYISELESFLSANKINQELINLMIFGVEIDRAKVICSYLESANADAKNAFIKSIKDNDAIKANSNNSALSFLLLVLSVASIKSKNLENVAISTITTLNDLIFSTMKKVADEQKQIIKDCYIGSITSNNFVEWNSDKYDYKAVKAFTDIVIDVIREQGEAEQNKLLLSWLVKGSQKAETEIERQRIEADIPQSKVNDIRVLVEHYEKVEKILLKTVHDKADLEKLLASREAEIAELKRAKSDLEYEVKSLKGNIDSKNQSLDAAQKEIEERKELNKAQTQYREDSQASLLKEIAGALKAEYSDYAESKNDEMDVMLGEIYRDKVGNIFKILESKGIKVE